MEASKEETEGAVQDFALDVGAVSVLFGREEGGGGAEPRIATLATSMEWK